MDPTDYNKTMGGMNEVVNAQLDLKGYARPGQEGYGQTTTNSPATGTETRTSLALERPLGGLVGLGLGLAIWQFAPELLMGIHPFYFNCAMFAIFALLGPLIMPWIYRIVAVAVIVLIAWVIW